MAPISLGQECTVGYSDHAKHLSFACNDLFEQQTFSDVTLASDGYFFNGHRLLLAAFSPYFQQMLINVPANQHAIVFMKDVSKQTLYSLMKYIYCGEVNVDREHLDELISTAISLQVNGFIDGQNPQFSECQPMNPSFPATKMASKPNMPGFQYQSTSASMRAQTPLNLTSSTTYPVPSSYDHQHDTKDENVPETKVDTHASDEISKMNFFKIEDQFDDDQIELTSEPKRKRIKRNDDALLDYNIVADIQSMNNGRQRLFHNYYKFYAQHTGLKTTRWLCTRHATKKCNAIISTTKLDGKSMMKIVRGEHTHGPQE